MRINARLDERSEENLEYIKQVTGENVTRIIKDLLEERARQLRQRNKPGAKLKALLDSDFVGCGEGPEDGSTNYKKYFADYLDDKYPDR